MLIVSKYLHLINTFLPLPMDAPPISGVNISHLELSFITYLQPPMVYHRTTIFIIPCAQAHSIMSDRQWPGVYNPGEIVYSTMKGAHNVQQKKKNFSLLWVIFLAGILFTGGCGGGSGDSGTAYYGGGDSGGTTQGYAVSGTFRDATNTQPVQGATCTLTQTRGGSFIEDFMTVPKETVTVNSTTTDQNGQYSFTGVPSGTYTMQITKSGYVTISVDNLVVNGDITGLSQSSPQVTQWNAITGTGCPYDAAKTYMIVTAALPGKDASRTAGISATITPNTGVQTGYMTDATPSVVDWNATATYNNGQVFFGNLSPGTQYTITFTYLGTAYSVLAQSGTAPAYTITLTSPGSMSVLTVTLSTASPSPSPTPTPSPSTSPSPSPTPSPSPSPTQGGGGGGGAPPAPTTGTVKGFVMDIYNCALLKGVTITSGSASTTTDDNGYFSLSGVTSGSQTVTASKTGYNNNAKSVTVVASGTTAQNYLMTWLPEGGPWGFAYSGSQVATGSNPIAGAMDDFDQDGKQDLATTNYNVGTVSVLIGNGDGTFQGKTDFAVGFNPASAVAGDFNKDTWPDLAVANSSGGGVDPCNVSVLINKGKLGGVWQGFNAAVNKDVAGCPRCVAIGDFTNDGFQDLVTGDSSGNSLSVLINKGGVGVGWQGFDDAFSVSPAADCQSPYSLVTGDFTGDGEVDIAGAFYSTDNVGVFRGDGSGGFVYINKYTVGDGPISITTGLFNADARLDLATANRNSDNVSVLINDGAGSFNDADSYSVGVGSNPFSVIAGDFDGDNHVDLATANYGTCNVSVLIGNAGGTFTTPAPTYSTVDSPRALVGGNLNGDDKPDLAVIDDNNSKVLILLNSGTGTFNVSDNYNVGTAPRSVTVGDFNGDGKLDIATASKNSFYVSVWMGDGLGAFADRADYGVGDTPYKVAVGDFNGDGKLDIATANSGTDTVSVLLGDGLGGFAAKVDYGAGSQPYSVAVGDFNCDGKLDIATANLGSNSVSVLLGDGLGGFAAKVDYGAGTNPYSVAVGDFNGDGNLDNATANLGSDNVSVLLGDGAGAFGAATNFGVGSGPNSVAVGDFNGNGTLDIATANSGSNKVSVLLGNGLGGFAAKVDYSVGTQPYSVAAGDFNGDGKPDLVTANGNSRNISVLPGDGAGGFGSAINYSTEEGPSSVAVGDFNNDGKPDLVNANSTSNSISVKLNR